MMEFMMKFGFDSAALALCGQGPGARTGAQIQVPEPGLGLQHQMACLTNNTNLWTTSLLWYPISHPTLGCGRWDE